MFGGLDTVAFSEGFSLERHTLLYRNAAAQRFDALDVAFGDGFRMVKEPVQPVERDIAVHFLKDIQHPADRLVIGCMQAERPAVLHQMTHHAFKFDLRSRR
ncbi:hypothetical protein SRABI106_04553 [Rahnella aquatilis]|nr:hypothetical protein SRABI106_04553 [Rahnella aquatilis]